MVPHVMQTDGEYRYSPLSLDLGARWRGRHARGNLLQRKNASTHWRGWVGPREGLDMFEFEKISYSNWNSNSIS